MLSDLEISRQVELTPINAIAERLGLDASEVEAHGQAMAKVSLDSLKRLQDKPDGKLVLVTAITPTPLGEGKTVTTVGLVQGLARLDKSVAGCLRQPSLGPVFGIKGGAAGGGYSQLVPMESLNLHLTGDLHAVTSAHNLAAAALDARLFHEQKQGGAAFTARTDLPALDIDPKRIVWRRVVDHNDRALREIQIGLCSGPRNINGVPRSDGFDITAASELMAILALCTDLQDLRARIGRIVLAYSRAGEPITTEQLGVAGAMTVVLRDAIKPTLMQTNEGVPCFIHAGPFANIAHGNSSVIADKMALKLADYVVTEAGFGSDMGFEKACNIKARTAGKTPDCAVLVATVRALKSHGTQNAEITEIDERALKSRISPSLFEGFDNLRWHIQNVRKYGMPVVVALNRFPTDSDEELQWLAEQARIAGADEVAISAAFARGGKGAEALAQAVVRACEQPSEFSFLYQAQQSLQEKLCAVAEKGYGATGVQFSELAQQQLAQYHAMGYGELPVCMAKSPASISHDPKLKGVPTEFELPVREVRLCAGAGFVYALTGNVMTMPGLPERPAYLGMDIDEQGNIVGLA